MGGMCDRKYLEDLGLLTTKERDKFVEVLASYKHLQHPLAMVIRRYE